MPPAHLQVEIRYLRPEAVRETINVDYAEGRGHVYGFMDGGPVGFWKGEPPKRNVVPSIHMPKWAARTWLEVLSVSVERVQNVMEGDAIAEGYESGEKSASDQFWDSWDKRYPGSTDRNDWVFVYKFKKVEDPNGRA